MIITLCGSLRFERAFHVWNEILSFDGHIVITVSVYPSAKPAGKEWYTERQKIMLDQIHKKKIEASDAIFVIDRDESFARPVYDIYIGASTKGEILHAELCLKTKFYASKTCVHPQCHTRLTRCLVASPA